MEDVLQPHLSPIPTIGFDDPAQFLQSVRISRVKERYNWLVVIADVAALYPNVEEGIFCQICKNFSNCRAVAFTADPSNPAWDKLREDKTMLEGHAISRADPGAVRELVKLIENILKDFQVSVDSITRVAGRNRGPTSALPPPRERIAKSTETAAKARTIPPGPEKLRESVDSSDEQERESRSTTSVTLDDLVQPNSRLYRLLTKDTLNLFQRLLLREAAWDLFTKLSNDDPKRLEKYRRFANSAPSPKKKSGRGIIGDVLRHFPKAQDVHHTRES